MANDSPSFAFLRFKQQDSFVTSTEVPAITKSRNHPEFVFYRRWKLNYLTKAP